MAASVVHPKFGLGGVLLVTGFLIHFLQGARNHGRARDPKVSAHSLLLKHNISAETEALGLLTNWMNGLALVRISLSFTLLSLQA